MDGKVEGRWLGTSPCDNERHIALKTKCTPRLRGEFIGADTTGPAVASRYSFEVFFSKICAHSERYRGVHKSLLRVSLKFKLFR